MFVFFFFFKQKTAYEMVMSDWSSDVCSSDLQFFDSLIEVGDGEELPMPERGQYPTFHDADGVFDLGFVARFVGPGGQDRNAVVLSHLVIGAVEIRLIAACPR